MPQDLFSVEQVADLLGLHVRTVRSYVREGRLQAVRIGKQYRIARADLEAFAGHPIASATAVRRDRYAEVSSVIYADAISPDEASRVTNTLMAAMKGRDAGSQPVRIDSAYDAERGRLSVILSGGLMTVAALIKLTATLTGFDE